METLLNRRHRLHQNKEVKANLFVALEGSLHFVNASLASWHATGHIQAQPHDGERAIAAPDAELLE
jgi:hypothetical protein